MNKSLIIIGCGGHAKSVSDVALSSGYTHLIFIDKNAKLDEKIYDFPVFSDLVIPETSSSPPLCHIGLGDLTKKRELFLKLQSENNLKFEPIISTSAYIGRDSNINDGVFIGHGAHIGPLVTIGKNSIINTHSVIEHEVTVGNHCHISVNSTVAGTCKIGDSVFVGAGATIIDKLKICSNVIIGANAVVVKDIVCPGVYVGNPAQLLRKHVN